MKAYKDGGLVEDELPAKVPIPTPDPREEYRGARRTLSSEPPVTVMEDIVGRFNEAKGQSNAFRDAIRQGCNR